MVLLPYNRPLHEKVSRRVTKKIWKPNLTSEDRYFEDKVRISAQADIKPFARHNYLLRRNTFFIIYTFDVTQL